MNQIRLRNRLWKSRSIDDKLAYRQRNSCLDLVRKLKRNYYNNLDHKKVIDNKPFWKFVKPHIFEIKVQLSKISLI